LSPELLLIIRKAKYNKFILREINKGKNPLLKPLHKEFTFRLSNNPTKTANNLREYLGINKRLQSGFKNSETAFTYYRNLIENNGVFVFQYPLQDARGFSLMDNEFPVIVLNSREYPTGKTFSLFHELCHILFNTGGVFRDIQTGDLKKNAKTIETFCNQFASDFLLPSSELLNEELVINNKNNKEWKDAILQEIADIYKISKEVVLLKLLENNLTTRSFYLKAKAKWVAEFKKDIQNKKKQEGGPTYHTTNISHLGKNFISKILTSYHAGNLTAQQVADFLNIKISRIKEYEQKIF
jgi:Zn-dependent peptidase ImmA (M78 family)